MVNVNADLDAALHYQRTVPLVGDARATLRRLIEVVREQAAAPTAQAAAPTTADPAPAAAGESSWLRECRAARADWEALKADRLAHPTLPDPVWGREVLTQPAAIAIATAAAHEAGAVVFFDAGDVQANGFQLAADDVEGRTITDGGASYMGFATCAVLATALGPRPWRAVAMTGDGSFTMNPAVLIDMVEHGATGVVVVFDNRRMGAISSLQRDQYGQIHATSDSVVVDYVAWANAVHGVRGIFGGYTPDDLRAAMREALGVDGVALVHVPVYFGDDPRGGLGAYGRWNVGSWVADTQALRHRIGL